MTVGKQASDVHTPCLNQMIVDEWFKQYDVDAHIKHIQDIYRKNFFSHLSEPSVREEESYS